MSEELNGLVRSGGEFDCIYIGDECVADFYDVFDGINIKLKYFISEKPIDPSIYEEQFLYSFYQGKANIDGSYMVGTEWTGTYGKCDQLEVCGHDITEELYQHIGKYCHLVVTCI